MKFPLASDYLQQMEFEWVLREEVHQLLKKLKFILIVS